MIDILTGERLDEETVAALASGRTDPAVALFIESVLELRGLPTSGGDALAGVWLETETPAPMSADALAKALTRISATPQVRPRAAADRSPIVVPAPLRSAVEEAEAQRGWKWAGPGIRSLDIVRDGGIKAQLLRIEAGRSTPRHTHVGKEYTLCLQGGFTDSRGSYGPGDVAVGDPSIVHTPTADEDGPCLVLAITDADLKFTGVMGLIQRLTGA